MEFKLFHKLFAGFLVTIAGMVIVLALAMHFLTDRSFSDYVKNVELGRLDRMAEKLAIFYGENHSWDPLRHNWHEWRRLIDANLPEAPKRGFFGGPPPRPPAGERWFPGPPHENGRFSGLLHGPSKPGPRQFVPPLGPPPGRWGERPPPPWPPPPGPPGGKVFLIGPRLTLFDAEKHTVVGPADAVDNHGLRPIKLNGKTVGWLGIKPVDHLSHPLNEDFLRQQTTVMFTAGAFALILAGTMCFLLSRHILAPVQKLTKGTRDLTSFNFDTRIDVTGKDELGQLAHDFNMMAQALARYEELRKQWISDISHELRTPLSILRGEIEAMQDGVRNLDSAALESLRVEVDNIGKLVEDLHLLSIADSEGLCQRKEPVQPITVLKDTLRSFDTRMANANIRLELRPIDNGDITMEGDSDRLAQLFANLTENSIRYTHSPGTLFITYRRSSGTITLVFEDTAPGVPSEALEHLFERLYRVDRSRSRELGGSGLGLSICKEIVEAHGGSIRADHASAGGLRISIEFPIIRI